MKSKKYGLTVYLSDDQKNLDQNLLKEIVKFKKKAFKELNPTISFGNHSKQAPPDHHEILHLEAHADGISFISESEQPWDEFKMTIRQGYEHLRKPFSTSGNLSQAIVMALLSWVFTFMAMINTIFLRGWRLEIVKNMALSNGEKTIPETIPNLFTFFRRGLVLIVMRAIYFLPHLLVLTIVTPQLFNLFIDFFWWVWDIITGDKKTILEFLIAKIPEVMVSVIIEFVMVLLYFLIVWPIYRINMIKYAQGLIRGYQFLSPGQIRHSIMVYRENADLVLGICFFYLCINFFCVVSLSLLTTFTFGAAYVAVPFLLVFIRHWPIAYAYGWLATKIQHSLVPKTAHQPANESVVF
ncbi:MAG: hypothetical protein R3D00_11005 [Bacteroidia bacterium]